MELEKLYINQRLVNMETLAKYGVHLLIQEHLKMGIYLEQEHLFMQMAIL